MLRQKSFMRLLALVVAASCLFAVGGRVRVRAQQQPAPQAQSPKPSKPDETLDEEGVERVETDLANVLFTAVDKNKRFITTIRQEDVRVLEDGVEQKVFTFQREVNRPLSLAILIDTSNSQERTLPEEKRAAQQFVDAVIRPQKDEVTASTNCCAARFSSGSV